MRLFFHKNLISKLDHFYCGVSSGIDSIALAHYLVTKKYNFSIVHINNKFTTHDDLMAESVVKFCDDFHIKYKMVVSIPDVESGHGKEDSCRKTRIDAFKELDSTVLTAHNLSDCVEQHYMNFFRGCEQFYPIPVRTPLDGTRNGFIIRPFMLNTRAEIEEYVNDNNLIKYVIEDPLNKDQSCRRAWIRHTLIPIVESLRNADNGGQQITMEKIVKTKVQEQYNKF